MRNSAGTGLEAKAEAICGDPAPPQGVATQVTAREDAAESPSLETVLFDKPGHLIRRLQQIAIGIFLEETAGADLTPVQYAVLAAVRAYPGIDQIRLASTIGYDRSTIGSVLDRLEGKALITRSVPKHNRRVKVLNLTAEGIALMRDIRSSTDRAQRRMLDPLGDTERAKFIAMLSRVVWAHNEDSRAPVRRRLERPDAEDEAR